MAAKRTSGYLGEPQMYAQRKPARNPRHPRAAAAMLSTVLAPMAARASSAAPPTPFGNTSEPDCAKNDHGNNRPHNRCQPAITAATAATAAGLQWQQLAAPELSRDEIEQCYQLVRKIRALYLAAGVPWSRRDKLIELTKTDNLEYILIRGAHQQIMGFASFVADDLDDHGDPCAFLYEFHLCAALHGTGIADLLMDTVSRCSKNGIVTLRTFKCNVRAVRFYNRLGFSVDRSLSSSGILYMVRRQ